MFLVEPPPSSGDIHFTLFGIPIRIHPFFWVMCVLLGLTGGGGDGTPPLELLAWVGAVVLSLLVHEMGHAWMQRRYGGHPWITLYSMGGMASCDDCDRSPKSQILISLAGPGAGFALALALIVLLRLSGFEAGWTLGDGPPALPSIPLMGTTLYLELPSTTPVALALYFLLWINVYWGVINLLPIYPLDGGQVSRELCQLGAGGRRGIVLSLQISMVAGGAMALYGLTRQSLFMAILFGYLAYQSYGIWDRYRTSY